MGQWKLQLRLGWHIGGLLSLTRESIQIWLPFVVIYIGLRSEAEGVDLFGWNPEMKRKK